MIFHDFPEHFGENQNRMILLQTVAE